MRFSSRLAFMTLIAGAVLSPLTVQAAADPQYPPQPALYVFSDGDSTLHLYGSAHLIKKGEAWRTDTFNHALAHADEIWLEIAAVDMLNPAMMNKISKSGVDPLHSLPERLSKEEYERLEIVADRLGIQLNSFDHYRPWVLAMLLPSLHQNKKMEKGEVKATRFNPGVEILVETMALGRPIKSLENVDNHMLLFSLMSEQDEKAFLLHTLQQIEKEDSGKDDADSKKLMEAWRGGDIETLHKMTAEEMKPTAGLYDIMMVKRNREMADNILRELRGKGNDMVIVGAAHLGGPDGVVALLEKAGYKGKRVYDEKPPVPSTTNRPISPPMYRHMSGTPDKVYMRLKKDPGGNADTVFLNMYVPVAMNTCAEVSPIQYYIQNGSDAYDIVTSGFTITNPPKKTPATCGVPTKTISVDIPLKLSHLRERGIDKLRLWWKGGIDTYSIAMTDGNVTLTPPKKPLYYRIKDGSAITLELAKE